MNSWRSAVLRRLFKRPVALIPILWRPLKTNV
jgi:hypothetical protein